MMRMAPLIRRKDFIYLSKSRLRAVSASLIIQMVHWPIQGYDWDKLPKKYSQKGIPTYRVGYTASKKVGNSVARNLAKRRLREAVRSVFKDLSQEISLEKRDYVIIARHTILNRDFRKVCRDLSWAVRQTDTLSRKKSLDKSKMVESPL